MAADCRSRSPKRQFISHILLLGAGPGMPCLRLGQVYGSDGWSSIPLAGDVEREHQWTSAPVFPKAQIPVSSAIPDLDGAELKLSGRPRRTQWQKPSERLTELNPLAA
jgi:hypothetical protein